jgi:hypothetical protein
MQGTHSVDEFKQMEVWPASYDLKSAAESDEGKHDVTTEMAKSQAPVM